MNLTGPSLEEYKSLTIVSLVLLFIFSSILVWRLAYHYTRASHPRRLWFHVSLLAATLFQCPFWLTSLDDETTTDIENSSSGLTTSIAFLLLSVSCTLCCILAIYYQWTNLLLAGLVGPQPSIFSGKKFNLLHILLLLHVLQMGFTLYVSIVIWSTNLNESSSEPQHNILQKLNDTREFYICIALTLFTTLVDSVATVGIGLQLQYRLASCLMPDALKQKSMRQVNCAIVVIMLWSIVHLVLELPIVIKNSLESAWGSWSFVSYAFFGILLPSVLISTTFMYLMRRRETKKPARLLNVTPGTNNNNRRRNNNTNNDTGNNTGTNNNGNDASANNKRGGNNNRRSSNREGENDNNNAGNNNQNNRCNTTVVEVIHPSWASISSHYPNNQNNNNREGETTTMTPFGEEITSAYYYQSNFEATTIHEEEHDAEEHNDDDASSPTADFHFEEA